MQFSILGVQFKCTKDMFDQEPMVASACMLWAMLWRSFLSILGLALIGGVLVGLSFAVINSLGGIIGAMVFFFGGILIFAIYILVWGYWQHYALYKKRYQSFDKLFTTVQPTIQSFTWQFWKPYLIFFCMGILFSLVVEILASHAAGLLNLLFWLFFIHISFHSGTWGFVPAPKKSALTN